MKSAKRTPIIATLGKLDLDATRSGRGLLKIFGTDFCNSINPLRDRFDRILLEYRIRISKGAAVIVPARIGVGAGSIETEINVHPRIR